MGALSKCKQVFTYLDDFGSLLATLVHYFGNFGSLFWQLWFTIGIKNC